MSFIEYEQSGAPASSRRATIVLILIITLLGGILRFTKISRPPLWGDEAATYSRVCGSYQEMIDILQFNLFAPLHYELYHWIASGMPAWARVEYRPVEPVRSPPRFFQRATTKPTSRPTTKPYLVGEHPIVPGGVQMTPVVMRLVPATAGTLMIPAMYFLSRQLVNRRAALIATIFTATSAYMLVYSRDAKMYMHFWLCCTLSVASLLWWLRGRTRVSWLCWVAASVAMCGLHALGGIVLAIELLMFLSYGRRWAIPGLIILAGLVAAAAMQQRSAPLIVALALAVIAFLSQRRRDWKPPVFFLLGLAIILSGIGAYALNFNRSKQRIEESGNWMVGTGLGWIDPYNRERDGPGLLRFTASAYLMSWEWAQAHEEKWIDVRALKLLRGSAWVVGALVIAGSFCTRRRNDSAIEAALPVGRRALWIMTWIVVPAYALYCISMGSDSTLVKGVWTPGFVSPHTWMIALFKWMHDAQWWALAVACAIAIAFFLSNRPMRERLWRAGGILAALVIVYVLCQATYFLLNDLNYRAVKAGDRWHSLWMPRYLGVIWPAFAIAVAAMLARLPTRPLRYGAVGLVVAVNLAQFVARLRQSEPPTDVIAADMLQKDPTRTYLLGNFAHGWGVAPGEGLYMSYAWRYYMAELSDMQITPRDFRLGPQRFITDFRPRTNRTVSVIVQDASRAPQVMRLVVWDKIERSGPDQNRDDPLKAALGAQWRRIDEQTFTAFDHWTWQKMYSVRRREYVRVG